MNTTTVVEQANTSAEGLNAQTQTETTSLEGKVEPKLEITQKDLDNMMAKTRGATEREFLKSLGLESKEALAKVKEAYQSSLTAEEKLSADLETYKNTAQTYEAKAAEYESVLAAMEAITGKHRAEVETVVKMAKGLVSDDLPINEAIQKVIAMTTPHAAEPAQQQAKGLNIMKPSGEKPSPTISKYQQMYDQAKTVQQKVAVKQEAFKNGVIIN